MILEIHHTIFLPEPLRDVDGGGVSVQHQGQLAGHAPLAIPLLPGDKLGLSHQVRGAQGSLHWPAIWNGGVKYRVINWIRQQE